ncbi:hypothetical protein CMI37_15250 [Candidatus Pacearchaeota archaeon]|nr:hypothetical protein [Candidatus Pacearchaeota archaeon]
MSCFFPPIFKKNTYKRVRLLLIVATLGLVMLMSGCKAVRSVAAAPFKAIGWGASKVSEVVAGEEVKSKPKIYELNPDGSLSEKNAGKEPIIKKNNIKINFKALMIWGIILVIVGLIARFLINRYVYKVIKE